MNARHHKGPAFTLVEVLVVISILAVLASIMVPALGKARQATRLTLCATRQRAVVSGLNLYMADNDNKLPPRAAKLSYQQVHTNELYMFNDCTTCEIPVSSVGRRLRTYLPDAEVFICPLSPYDMEQGHPMFADMTLQQIYDASVDPPPLYNLAAFSSYSLLWNFSWWQEDGFRPESIGHDTLMIADRLYFTPYGADLSFPTRWSSPHPYPGMFDNPSVPESNWAWRSTKPDGSNRDNPIDVAGNAGYLAGHVQRTRTDTWIPMTQDGQNTSVFYIFVPPQWK